jgi:hypothetical protein
MSAMLYLIPILPDMVNSMPESKPTHISFKKFFFFFFIEEEVSLSNAVLLFKLYITRVKKLHYFLPNSLAVTAAKEQVSL